MDRLTASSTSKFVLPVLTATVGFILWGSSLAMVKLAQPQCGPIFLVFARMALALCLVSPLLFTDKFKFRVLPPRKDILLLSLLVLCEPLAAFIFEALAMRYTAASQAGMIWALGPLVYTLGGWLLFREGISPAKGACFLAALGGVILLTLAGGASGHAPDPMLGNFFVLLSMAGGTGFVLILRYLRGRYNPVQIIWVQSLGATVLLLPGLLSGHIHLPVTLDAPALGALLYLTLAVTLGAQALSAFAISKVTVPAYAALSNLIPVSGVLCGLLFLGERLAPLQWLACAVVLGAVIAGQRADSIEKI